MEKINVGADQIDRQTGRQRDRHILTQTHTHAHTHTHTHTNRPTTIAPMHARRLLIKLKI